MSLRHAVKPVLKRGALLAAANWPVALIQSAADSLFKLLIAAPLVGGIFLAALVVGAEPRSLMTLDSRELAATIVEALLSHPLVLASFLLSLGIVAVGGSVFVFLIKGGTVAVLVRSEREAGAIEEPPLHFSTVAGASRFSIEFFIESARALFPRYLRLGFILMGVYLASGVLYLAAVYGSRHGGSWLTPTLLTAAFVCWITLVNFVYLLVQIVIATDDCSVGAAAGRVAAFLRHERRHVWGVFLVILVMVVFATGASLLATAALGLIAVVPFIGLTVLPLEILAWLFRELVFEYIGLASVGAYVKLYREYAMAVAPKDLPTGFPVLGPAGH